MSRSCCGDFAPAALSKTRSPAGKASGQRSARMAMYCAVQSPIPGNACKREAGCNGVGAGLQVKLSAGDGLRDRADARGARGRDPECGDLGRRRPRQFEQAVGLRRSSPWKGVSIGSP